MKFFRKSADEPSPAEVEPAPEPGAALRRVEPGDVGHGRVVASLTTPPGVERDARAAAASRAMDPGAEHWVLDGLDGTPVGVLTLTPHTDALLVWGGVDPVMRRFGVGARLLEHAAERARSHGLGRLRCVAEQQSAYTFLMDHGFVATETDGPRVTAELEIVAAG